MPRVKLADFIEREYADASTIVELSDGTDFIMPPSEMWPDEAFDAARQGDIRTCVILTVGEDEYARFCKAGGNWRILNAIVAAQQGVEVPQSSASSTSSASSVTPSKRTSGGTTRSGSKKH